MEKVIKEKVQKIQNEQLKEKLVKEIKKKFKSKSIIK
jgi:hypothetical protein